MGKFKKAGFCMAAFFIVSLFGGYIANSEAADKIKIGYADIALVFDSYNKTKDLDATLSSKGDKKKKEHDAMVEKIKNMKNEFELLTDEQKQKKQDQLDEEVRKLQDFDRQTKEDLRQERDAMVREILKETDSVIKDYSQKNGYTIVLNSRVLVYAQEEDNITQEILKILNSRYGGAKKK